MDTIIKTEAVTCHSDLRCYVCGKTIIANRKYTILKFPWYPNEQKRTDVKFDYYAFKYPDRQEKRQAVCSKECEMLGIFQGI